MTGGYTFDPVERGGVILGLTVAQLVELGAGGLLVILVGRVVGGVGGGVLAVVLLLVIGAATCWPVRGRPPLAWLPVGVGWGRRRIRPARLAAPPAASLLGPRPVSAPHALPPGVAVSEVEEVAGGAPFAAVRDTRASTWVGALAVQGRTLPLLDGDDQRGHLASWGALLAGLARPGTPLHRVQWVARVQPGRHPDDREHEVLVVLAVRGRRGEREVLGRELRLLAGQLGAADLAAGPPLDIARYERALGAGDGPAARWPRATNEGWEVWRADGAWHATFWVAEWPRVEVPPDFLASLLLTGGSCRVAVTMGPVPAGRAARQIESARTASAADDELRRRAGFVATARRARRAGGMARREAELADGHADYRFSGYVTVSGADRAVLDRRCAEVEQVAQTAGLDLARLWGQQAEAFTWTLPLARGLR